MTCGRQPRIRHRGIPGRHRKRLDCYKVELQVIVEMELVVGRQKENRWKSRGGMLIVACKGA